MGRCGHVIKSSGHNTMKRGGPNDIFHFKRNSKIKWIIVIIQYEIQHSVHLIHSFHSFFFRSSLVLTWVLLLLFRLLSKFLIWSWAVRGIIFAIMGLNFILENCNDTSLQWFDKKSKRNFENLWYVFYLFDKKSKRNLEKLGYVFYLFDKKSKRNLENLGYVFYLFDISGFSVEFWIVISYVSWIIYGFYLYLTLNLNTLELWYDARKDWP